MSLRQNIDKYFKSFNREKQSKYESFKECARVALKLQIKILDLDQSSVPGTRYLDLFT